MKMTEAKEKENQESGLIETEREESLTKQADTSCRGQVRKKKLKTVNWIQELGYHWLFHRK